jgi:CMP-N-acetylneuraminic acid synthetase
MIPALLLGRKGSTGFPGKNTYNVMGYPLAYYPMKAALDTSEIDKIYLSTDDPKLMRIARNLDVEIIVRPDYLCVDSALGEDAYVHGYEEIEKMNPGTKIEMIVLLMCNTATINAQTLSQGIKALRDNPNLDSAVTVSRYNMWSPLRARKLDENGLLKPFVPFETFGDPKTLSCDRDSQGDVFFADMGASIVRSHCLKQVEAGLLPQKWMGNSIYPLHQEAGCDVDYEWQIPVVEWWLKKYGGKV